MPAYWPFTRFELRALGRQFEIEQVREPNINAGPWIEMVAGADLSEDDVSGGECPLAAFHLPLPFVCIVAHLRY